MIINPGLEAPAKQHTLLTVDWDVDSVLVTGDWVGFQLPTVKDREREGLLATRLAGSYTSAVMIAVITAAQVDRRLVVSGTVYAVGTGTAWRSGSVELTGRGDNKQLEQLAAYLGFQSPADGVTVIERTAREAKPTRNAAPAPPPARPAAPSATSRPAPPAPPRPASSTPPRPTPPTAARASASAPRPRRSSPASARRAHMSAPVTPRTMARTWPCRRSAYDRRRCARFTSWRGPRSRPVATMPSHG